MIDRLMILGKGSDCKQKNNQKVITGMQISSVKLSLQKFATKRVRKIDKDEPIKKLNKPIEILVSFLLLLFIEWNAGNKYSKR